MANGHKKTGQDIKCKNCGKPFCVEPYLIRSGRKKFCSKDCFYQGRELKMLFAKGHPDLVPPESRGCSEETRRKISASGKGKHTGPLAWNWISDRKNVKLDNDRGGPLHKQWSRSVKNRDHWKCKLADGNCSGRVVAHHILTWRDHVELRYNITNGITLCHFHHPRRREDEKKLAPLLSGLVANNRI